MRMLAAKRKGLQRRQPLRRGRNDIRVEPTRQRRPNWRIVGKQAVFHAPNHIPKTFPLT